MTLREIHAQARRCRRCHLHKTRLNVVPGEGSSNAKVMFVGEAPGAEEDKSGRPFVGRSGELLTKMLEEIGLKRESVFITSVLKCRPPRNRTPLVSEIEACIPYLHRQIEAINPRIIVLLGGVAISSVIGPWKLSDAHGRFYEYDGRTFFMTYHPAAALRFPKIRTVMRSDMQALREELSMSGG
ncbi:MAG: uracil-DNA glycosylase [Candidatus Thorarchaeota archaeon]